MSTWAFVQARMGSTRLPGKVLEPLAGKPALERMLERLAAAPGVDEVAVLTSDLPRDEVVARLAEDAGFRAFAGSESDVLDRFARAAAQFGADQVVRCTADCPLIDPEVVGRLLELYAAGELDLAAVATGALPPEPGLRRFPDGLDAEVLSAELLAVAAAEAEDPYEREHVTPFFYRRPERFTSGLLQADEDLGHERWTVDHPEDLELVQAIWDRLAPTGRFGFRDVLALLDREPSLRQLNAARLAHPRASS
ncbi:MAG: cytidylyltransferase domain-containing protein [Thermoleophilaceae bacterium]